MNGKFGLRSDIERHAMPWGSLRWLSHPPSTGANQLTVVEATFAPGEGHSFHRHPDQEEVIYVVAGTFEQWIAGEKRLIGPGDVVFIPPGIVHASFNAGAGDATMIATFGPVVSETGMEVVDMSGEAPWNALRAA
jgi:quercetin dioxygenase-like cupin family protein